MSKLGLSLACWDYDRTRALMEGAVPVDGIELNYLNLPVEETFFRMIRHREFDAAEISLSSYSVLASKEDCPFIAIPVFPSRVFRHGSIYVNVRSRIEKPSDLIGKRVGVPEFQMTAPVWIRGILAEHYGLPVESVIYCTGGEEEPGRPEKQRLDLPAQIRIEPIGPDKTLSQMLLDGEIDALYTARMPSAYLKGKLDGQVKRLFENYQRIEQEYFKTTGIFPIMHTVAIRRDLYEKHRWIAQSLTKAFVASQRRTYEDMYETAALKTMLPWLTAHVEEARDLMGENFWSYGLETNRKTLATFLRYHQEQGLSKRLLTPDELFAPESLESFKI
ncbi:MAG: ABC transporter substrate-binding protein [Xanthobacteraceae bacterium]|nr:ABC transporter substrate-binding protein [Xanthobacteraceae bacterium]